MGSNNEAKAKEALDILLDEACHSTAARYAYNTVSQYAASIAAQVERLEPIVGMLRRSRDMGYPLPSGILAALDAQDVSDDE